MNMDINVFKDCKSLSDGAIMLFGKNNYTNRNKVKKILNELNISDWKLFFNNKKEKNYCACCGKEIDSWKKYCSKSCSAKINNKNRSKEKKHCAYCGKEIDSWKKYCSNKCQIEKQNEIKLQQWINGEHLGCDKTGQISSFVKRYMLSLRGNKCECCGFNEVNPYTGNEILEIHHLDGNCFNNNIENLQVLCPNHHAMTNNYGSLNKNSGRKNRYKK